MRETVAITFRVLQSRSIDYDNRIHSPKCRRKDRPKSASCGWPNGDCHGLSSFRHSRRRPMQRARFEISLTTQRTAYNSIQMRAPRINSRQRKTSGVAEYHHNLCRPFHLEQRPASTEQIGLYSCMFVSSTLRRSANIRLHDEPLKAEDPFALPHSISPAARAATNS